jgi:solute carrier family 25 protein 34/35
VKAAMFRTSMGTSVQMPTYFYAKGKMVEYGILDAQNPLTIVLSSAVAGATVVSLFIFYSEPTSLDVLSVCN